MTQTSGQDEFINKSTIKKHPSKILGENGKSTKNIKETKKVKKKKNNEKLKIEFLNLVIFFRLPARFEALKLACG